jgi:hypothetical protein
MSDTSATPYAFTHAPVLILQALLPSPPHCRPSAMGTRRLRPLMRVRWAESMLPILRAGGTRPLCGGTGSVEKSGAKAAHRAVEGGGRRDRADVNAWRIAVFVASANRSTMAPRDLSAPRTMLDRRSAPRHKGRAKGCFDIRVRRVDGDVTSVDAPVLLLLCDGWIQRRSLLQTLSCIHGLGTPQSLVGRCKQSDGQVI